MITIKIADNAEEKRAALQLRYDVFVEEVGLRLKERTRSLGDPFDSFAKILIAKNKTGRVVGTCRFVKWNEVPVWLKQNGVPRNLANHGLVQSDVDGQVSEVSSITSRLVVANAYRSSLFKIACEVQGHQKTTSVVGGLVTACYQLGQQEAVAVDWVTCRQPLLGSYIRLGYRVHSGGIQVSESSEPKYLLYLVVNDQKHLKKVRSPFRRLVSKSTEMLSLAAMINERLNEEHSNSETNTA